MAGVLAGILTGISAGLLRGEPAPALAEARFEPILPEALSIGRKSDDYLTFQTALRGRRIGTERSKADAVQGRLAALAEHSASDGIAPLEAGGLQGKALNAQEKGVAREVRQRALVQGAGLGRCLQRLPGG